MIDTLGQDTGKQLSIWSHRDGSHWSETDRGDVIEKSLIKKYFLDSL